MMEEVPSLQAGTARHGGWREREGGGGPFGAMIKDALLMSFKYSALANETLPLQSPLCWLGQSQPLVESHPQVGGVVLSKQSLTVDMQVGLLFLYSKPEDGVGGLPLYDSDKPLLCLPFQDVQRLLHSIACSCKVFLWVPQDQVTGIYGFQDFTRHVSYNVADEDQEYGRAQDASLRDSFFQCLLAAVSVIHVDSGLSYLSGTGRSTGTYIPLHHFSGV